MPHDRERRVGDGASGSGDAALAAGDPVRGGFALVTVLLLLLTAGALLLAATMLASNQLLVSSYYERSASLETVADAGLERARALLNADPSLYPDSGYTVLEAEADVPDGSGGSLPGVERSLYAGPTGITSGQYGIHGSVVSVARDGGGGVAVRRLRVFQESFARYAYFTDVEPSSIAFGGGDEIWGPLHTNDELKIYSSGATFHDEARTAETVQGGQYGTFEEGYEEHVPEIAMPETAELTKLETQAIAGSTRFPGSFTAGSGSATTRIEFVALDLDGDGSTTGEDEGFLRVYQSGDDGWVAADVPPAGMEHSENCGHYHPDGTFVSAADHPAPDSWVASLTSSTRRCYLGGADSLSNGFVADDGRGQWLPWPGPTITEVSGRDDAGYLFPINRPLNPDFKGVVFVDGDVVISGRLRGRVTVAATGEIVLGDDLTYATDPGAGTCDDILGIFGGDRVVVADNTLNAPIRPQGGGSNYFTYDDSRDEFIHGVVLALDVFTVENHGGGSTRSQPCGGTQWGRGCLYLTGGVIQRERGPVGTDTWGPGGTGYLKRYSYDACAAESPPPYFPTTGHFARGATHPVDPVGFSVSSFYERFQAN